MAKKRARRHPADRTFKPRPSPPRVPADPDPETSDSEISSRKQRISAKDREFVKLLADSGFSDPDSCAKAVGWTKPGAGWRAHSRLSEIIESERLRRTLGNEMGLDEALRRIASLARQDEDLKVALASTRTVLEVHGALGKDIDPRDRKKLMREAEALLAEIRSNLPPGRVEQLIAGEKEAIDRSQSQSQVIFDVQAVVVQAEKQS